MATKTPSNTSITSERPKMDGNSVRQIGGRIGDIEGDDYETANVAQDFLNVNRKDTANSYTADSVQNFLNEKRKDKVDMGIKLEIGGGSVNLNQEVKTTEPIYTPIIINEGPVQPQELQENSWFKIPQVGESLTGTATNVLSLLGEQIPDAFGDIKELFVDDILGSQQKKDNKETNNLTSEEQAKLEEIKEKFAMEIASNKRIQQEQDVVSQINEQKEDERYGLIGASKEQVAEKSGYLNKSFRGAKTAANRASIAMKVVDDAKKAKAVDAFSMVQGRVAKMGGNFDLNKVGEGGSQLSATGGNVG